jgi:CheY-like chemotaxis protein
MPPPIYMVDDEEIDQVLFTRLARDAGVANPIKTFSSGEQLIDALIGVLRGAPMPLACFIDVKMPGMSGFDVLRWLRCQHALDDIAAVMLSSSEEMRDITEAQTFGAQCYVAKFPTADQLREIVREAERLAAASAAHPFKVSCNLLVESAQPIC